VALVPPQPYRCVECLAGSVDFPDLFAALVNNPAETKFIADAAADLVGEAHVDRNRSLITAAEDFAYMLEACPGAFINIGNVGTVSSCPVHNPHYDFNDAALPIGASLFARLVEKSRHEVRLPEKEWLLHSSRNQLLRK
jgi:hippurate hydrolase